jgi:hypothetical protein
MTKAAGTATADGGLADVLAQAGAAARSCGRDDLEAVLHLAWSRLQRPETVVCVAGEFKQGKSSLINALLGVVACPVDDDLATAALTVVRHGPRPAIRVRRNARGTQLVETIGPEQLAGFVTEAGNPGNVRGVQLVEIVAPNPLLARGWVFVDTPGIGGFNEAQAAAALGFLPAADALLFVTDAAAELGAHELAFLSKARAVCPTILVALTKIDLHPRWRDIAASDARHLAARGLAEPVPLSAVLRGVALRKADVELNVESGVPALLELLDRQVRERAREAATERGIGDARAALGQLILPLERELSAIRDPAAAGQRQEELAAVRDHLQALRGAGARWGQRLGDGFGELAASVDYGFRSRMRTILRETEEAIDAGDPARTWEAIAARLQGDVSAAVAEVFTQLLEGTARVRAELAALIQDAAIDGASELHATFDVGRLWSGKVISGSVVKSGLGLGFGALRGAQSGVYLLGLLGNLFQLAVIGPALLGGAVVFAGKSVVDERGRQLATRRMEARGTVRQYLDDVQFEVGTRMRDALRELQRELRDDVTGRVEELSRTYGEAVTRLEQAAKQDAEARRARSAELERDLASLRPLSARLGDVRTPEASGAAALAADPAAVRA